MKPNKENTKTFLKLKLPTWSKEPKERMKALTN